MITVHLKEDDTRSQELVNKLESLVITFEKEYHSSQEGNGPSLPYVEESGEVYENEEIGQWLRELESDLNWQRSISGDACYIAPDSDTIC